jgi:cysteine desulfurase
MSTARIYLDHITTTPPSERALQAMMPFMTQRWASPMSPYQEGQELVPALSRYLKKLYDALQVNENDTILVTSSGAEAVSHIVNSVYRTDTRSNGKNHFLVGSIDEAPSMLAMGNLEPFGCVCKSIAANNEGMITVDAVIDEMTPRTVLLSLSCANGLTGVVHPLAEIAKVCRARGVLFHLDITHVLGKIFLDLEEIKPDFMSLNGSQIHAPQGCGLLYARNGVPLQPMIYGGHEQGSLRGGELNMATLAALAIAAEEEVEALDFVCTEVARLRSCFEEEVQASCPSTHVFFADQQRLPHVSCIAFPSVANEALLFSLDQRGVAASIGGGRMQLLSLNLEACAVDPLLAQSAITFSFGRGTSENEVRQAAKIVAEEYKRLEEMAWDLQS